jgi:hypothetical protein
LPVFEIIEVSGVMGSGCEWHPQPSRSQLRRLNHDSASRIEQRKGVRTAEHVRFERAICAKGSAVFGGPDGNHNWFSVEQ